jgi:hypothetical protein
MKNYRLDKEMTEQEIDDFFGGDWIDVDFWTEGEGRATSNYEILRNDEVHILKSEHYSFGGYAQPTYYFITL